MGKEIAVFITDYFAAKLARLYHITQKKPQKPADRASIKPIARMLNMCYSVNVPTFYVKKGQPMTNGVCAVVGAGPGVSLAVARRFAREGYTPALVARTPTKLDGYVADLQAAGFTAHGFAADAGDPASLVAAFAQIKTTLDVPAVLVYNAALMRDQLPSTLPLDTLLADFTLNVGGALIAAQQVLPAMRARKQGTILFTGGGLALYPVPQYAALAMSKAALRNLTYTLGAEVAPDNIQVATVTIAGMVQEGTYFDPERIAEAFWSLHAQPAEQREREVIYRQPEQ